MIPIWAHTSVFLALTGAFIYNLVTNGNAGQPNSLIIGGLLGIYIAVVKTLQGKSDKDDSA